MRPGAKTQPLRPIADCLNGDTTTSPVEGCGPGATKGALCPRVFNATRPQCDDGDSRAVPKAWSARNRELTVSYRGKTCHSVSESATPSAMPSCAGLSTLGSGCIRMFDVMRCRSNEAGNRQRHVGIALNLTSVSGTSRLRLRALHAPVKRHQKTARQGPQTHQLVQGSEFPRCGYEIRPAARALGRRL